MRGRANDGGFSGGGVLRRRAAGHGPSATIAPSINGRRGLFSASLRGPDSLHLSRLHAARRTPNFQIRPGPFVRRCSWALAHADDYADVNTLLRQGKADEALTKADAYIAGKPRDPQMRFLRGVILTEEGKQTEAIAAFTR